MQTPFSSDPHDQAMPGLRVVYAQYLRHEPFSEALFDGFSSLRVLTYSASIPYLVRMLHRFETVECVFGCEAILQDAAALISAQKAICEHLLTVIHGLNDARKHFLLQKVEQGKARFFVVKGAVSHAKIYLLSGPERHLVIAGSANASDRAFAGSQAETIIAFENPEAWEYYQHEYELVKARATNEVSISMLKLEQAHVSLEDVPLLQEAQQAKEGLTVYVNQNVASASVPLIIHTVERVADQYRPNIQPLVKAQHGRVHLAPHIIGRMVQLVKTQKRTEQHQEPLFLSIFHDTQKVLLSGKELCLSPDWSSVQQDVSCLLEYFENFQQGFLGNVSQLQRDYFLFLCWFYFSPFLCDCRTNALVEQQYMFDFPLFAILYGKSNSGKTCLIHTIMKSMFGAFSVLETNCFTQTHLRELLHMYKRFPVVFDDVDKKRFLQHAPELIKDEQILLPEYPAFVLSMNADDHSFATELRKRCLILYTRASLPDNSVVARKLYRSISSLQQRISGALYREYLRRMLEHLQREPFPLDILHCSSTILVDIFREANSVPLPEWCRLLSIREYGERKYEKIREELLRLYEADPRLWEVRRREIILRVPQNESFGLRREIPDWLLKEGSKGGNIILDREHLEDFLMFSFRRRWWRFLSR
jgi:hypothetical protein